MCVKPTKIAFMPMRITLHLLTCTLFLACTKDKGSGPQPPALLYFPPVTGTWETINPASLGWNSTALGNTFDFLEKKNTKAFIILHNGRIAAEKYYGNFTTDSLWYWASAGKTLTATLVGIAQKEGLLSLSDPAAKYLGTGWTSLTPAQEQQITLRHLLTMTSGLDDGVPDDHCTLPSCLQFKAAPGTRWAYHNAPYTLLEKVVETASGKTYNTYFREKIRDRTGMNGFWLKNGWNNVYYSNARSMARFGLFMQARAQWNGTPLLNDEPYFNAMISTSQNLNLSYGYLWWLNGKASHMLPTVPFVFSGNLVPNAPADMYAGLGKNDQKIYVVPSQKLVIIRMGEAAGNTQLAVSSFDNELWGYLKQVF
jgi:CubicO group peptidase (beta-lactamase class C family)